MKDLLRNSMLALYRDNDVIYDALLQCDWSKLNYKFQQELFLRISPDRFYAMDEIMHSDAYILSTAMLLTVLQWRVLMILQTCLSLLFLRMKMEV